MGTPDIAPRPRSASASPGDRADHAATESAITWRQARRMLAAIDPLPPIAVPLSSAVGAVLVAPITAATDIPVGDAACDHGWAVAGQGPWTVVEGEPAQGLQRLPDGCAVPVAVGDPLPPGTTAVLERGAGFVDAAPHRIRLQVADPDGLPAAHPGLVPFGRGIVPQGREASAGQRLLSAGPVVTPATVALAAAVGRDDLIVIPPASVAVLLPNFGLARRGPLRRGRQRDAVAELLPTWVEAGPARLLPPVGTEADAHRIAEAIDEAPSDVVIVAGGLDPTVPEPVRDAVRLLDAEPIVGGLSIAPGGGTCAYLLPQDRYLVTLPGRPAAAAVGMAVVCDPLLAALSGRPSQADGVEAMLAAAVPPSGRTQVVPGILERSELVLRVHPRRWSGPGGLQGLAAADGLIVCEPGVAAQSFVPLLPLPGVLVG